MSVDELCFTPATELARQLSALLSAPVTGHDLDPTVVVHAPVGTEVLTEALDVAGPGVAEYFAKCKRQEFFDWHNTVSSWEIDRYLTSF